MNATYTSPAIDTNAILNDVLASAPSRAAAILTFVAFVLLAILASPIAAAALTLCVLLSPITLPLLLLARPWHKPSQKPWTAPYRIPVARIAPADVFTSSIVLPTAVTVCEPAAVICQIVTDGPAPAPAASRRFPLTVIEAPAPAPALFTVSTDAPAAGFTFSTDAPAPAELTVVVREMPCDVDALLKPAAAPSAATTTTKKGRARKAAESVTATAANAPVEPAAPAPTTKRKASRKAPAPAFRPLSDLTGEELAKLTKRRWGRFAAADAKLLGEYVANGFDATDRAAFLSALTAEAARRAE